MFYWIYVYNFYYRFSLSFVSTWPDEKVIHNFIVHVYRDNKQNILFYTILVEQFTVFHFFLSKKYAEFTL